MPPRKSRRKATLGGLLIGVLVTLVLLLAPQLNRAGPAASQDGITLYFSPRGGCTQAIVEQIDQAKTTILVQAYSFTSKPIAQALATAQRRGVRVTVIIDSEQGTTQHSEATFLLHNQVPVHIDARHAIAHNKIILIDGRTLITGSFNFTKQAEDANAENLLVIQDKPAIYAAYERNFQEHLGHSERYDAR